MILSLWNTIKYFQHSAEHTVLEYSKEFIYLCRSENRYGNFDVLTCDLLLISVFEDWFTKILGHSILSKIGRGKKKDNNETMWCHFSIAYFLSAWIVTVALIQMPVCQSVPEGIFQNNLHFIVFTKSKQYRHMENCASKPIPVLTRLPFFLGQVITLFSHALPLPASACQMCSVLWGPVPGTGHNPFRGPTRSPPCSSSELLQFHELACYMGICLQENK